MKRACMKHARIAALSISAMLLAGLCASAARAEDDPFAKEGPNKSVQARTVASESKSPPQPDDAEDQEPPLVLKAYDLGDLLLESPAPPRGVDELGDGQTEDDTNPSFGIRMSSYRGLLSGSFANQRDHIKASMPKSSIAFTKSCAYEEFTGVITSLIAPHEWTAVGGPSEIQVLGDLLLVKTTEKNHKEIASLLSVIRQRTAARKTVSVEVHWLWLNEQELQRLAPATATKEDGRVADPLVVDTAAWNQLAQERAKEDNEVRDGYHAIFNCLNGQTVVAHAGRQSRFIVTMIPVVGDTGEGIYAGPRPAQPASATPPFPITPHQSNGLSGYQPTTTTIQEGPAVEVRPILCGKSQVLLDIHSRIIETQTREGGEASANPPAAGSQAEVVRAVAAAVDRPQTSTHRIDTTLRAPLGRRVLAGGISYGSESDTGKRRLYVFVKAVSSEPQAAASGAKAKR